MLIASAPPRHRQYGSRLIRWKIERPRAGELTEPRERTCTRVHVMLGTVKGVPGGRKCQHENWCGMCCARRCMPDFGGERLVLALCVRVCGSTRHPQATSRLAHIFPSCTLSSDSQTHRFCLLPRMFPGGYRVPDDGRGEPHAPGIQREREQKSESVCEQAQAHV